MHSAIHFLAQHLELANPHVAGFIVSCFNEYVVNFLWNNPLVLDPDLAQIRARVHLTMAHQPVGWLWTQQTPEAQQLMGQDEHATVFVLRVLDFLAAEDLWPKDCGVDQAVYQIHQRLCVLQSLWLGNRVWVENSAVQAGLKRALVKAMEEAELLRTPSVA
jgi:hypothetical protein